MIEVSAAIMCTSLSALRPLATKYLPRLFAFITAAPHDVTTTRHSKLPGTYTSRSKGTRFSSFVSLLSKARLRDGSIQGGEEGEGIRAGQIYAQQTLDVRNEEWEEVVEMEERNGKGSKGLQLGKVSTVIETGEESDVEGGRGAGRDG
jgi:hypothetical protein